jgi:hypothetical protein
MIKCNSVSAAHLLRVCSERPSRRKSAIAGTDLQRAPIAESLESRVVVSVLSERS